METSFEKAGKVFISGLHPAAAVRFQSGTAADTRTARQSNSASSGSLKSADRQREFLEITRFRTDLRKLAADFGRIGSNSKSTSRPPLFSSPLGLQQSATYTTMESTEQLNTTTTAYGPAQPTFIGGSTVTPTISGTYTGSTDDVYTFRVSNSGFLVGLFSKSIEVRNQGGSLIRTLTIPAFYSEGTPLTVANGLSVSFSGTFLESNDTFQVSVFGNVDNQVNPANAFNGIGSQSANFNPGVTVTDGSFTVNGQTISVLANDSINSVLQKINQSTADVTATFDSVTERVKVESNTAGSSGNIVFGSDTSGFVAAVKLVTATATQGIDPDLQRRIADVVALQSIQSGTFVVNQTDLSTDVDVDSLQDVLERINGSTTDAVLQYESASDRIRLTPGRTLLSLQLQDGTSDLFSSLGLTTDLQEYLPPVRDSRSSGHRFRQSVSDFAGLLNRLVKSADSRALESQLQNAFAAAINADKASGSVSATKQLQAVGLNVGASDNQSFLQIDKATLASAVRQRGSAIEDLLLGVNRRNPGLLQQLDNVLSTRQQQLELYAATAGTRLIDFRA